MEREQGRRGLGCLISASSGCTATTTPPTIPELSYAFKCYVCFPSSFHQPDNNPSLHSHTSSAETDPSLHPPCLPYYILPHPLIRPQLPAIGVFLTCRKGNCQNSAISSNKLAFLSSTLLCIIHVNKRFGSHHGSGAVHTYPEKQSQLHYLRLLRLWSIIDCAVVGA